MTIDWNNFTPWSALLGGALIGAAAALFIVFNGRVAGISGVLGALFRPPDATPAGEGNAWRGAFVAGLLVAPLVYLLFAAWPAVVVDASYGALVLAGLLVGMGTRYGAGCTSGHGVCGVSRLSPRSLLATACFMAAGFATVYALRHVFNA